MWGLRPPSGSFRGLPDPREDARETRRNSTGLPRMILVTGASGFIGRALTSELDRRAIPWRAVPRASLEEPTRDFEPEEVLVHLAAIAHRTHGSMDDAEYERVNRDLAVSAALRARAGGVQRFVFVSTARVMGNVSSKPWTEQDEPNPPDAYSRAKREAEIELMRLRSPGTFEVAVLRPPLVYGPGVRGNFHRLLRLADSRWPLPLRNACAPRSMIAVANLVDAILFASTNDRMAGRIAFVRDESDVSVATLVRAMRLAFGRKERLFGIPAGLLHAAARLPLPGRRIEPLVSRLFHPCQVDMSFITGLGWRPPCDWRSQLALACAWYRADAQARSSPHG